MSKTEISTEKAMKAVKKKYDLHPYADIFPEMSPEELDGFANSVKSGGLLTPVLRYNGQIYDGKHRLAACEITGKKPIFEDYKPPAGVTNSDDISALLLHRVRIANQDRRHMSKGQLAIAAAKYRKFLSELAARRKAHGAAIAREKRSQKKSFPPPRQSGTGGLEQDSASCHLARSRNDEIDGAAVDTAEMAAEKFGTSKRTVQRASMVLKEAPEEIVKKVETGEISVNAAYSGLKPSEKKSKKTKQTEPDNPVFRQQYEELSEIVSQFKKYRNAYMKRGPRLAAFTARLDAIMREMESVKTWHPQKGHKCSNCQKGINSSGMLCQLCFGGICGE